MAWQCAICVMVSTPTLRLLLRHMNKEHSSNPNFNITCGINGCPKHYKKYHSFYKHVRSVHGSLYDKGPSSHDEIAREQHGCDETMDCETTSHMVLHVHQPTETYLQETPDSNEEDMDTMDEVQYKEAELQENASKFIIGLKEANDMTQVAVQAVTEGCQALVPCILQKFKQDIMAKLSNESTLLNIDKIDSHIEDVISDFPDPFEQIGVAHKDEKFMKENYNYVQAREIVLGTEVLTKADGHNSIKKDKCYYFPLKKSIEQFLQNETIFDLVTRTKKSGPEGYICDIWDGSMFKEYPILSNNVNDDKHYLYIQLYYDDLEYSNPLGASTNKLAMFYYRIANMEALYRSNLSCIRVLSIVETSYIKKYGIDRVLKPLLKDLKELDNEGWSLKIQDKDVLFKGSLQCIIGDTPASNSLGGFKESVGAAFDKCRRCQCTNPFMQYQFNENQFIQLTKTQYERKCETIANAVNLRMRDEFSKLYGINRKSVLCDAPNFDITQMIPFDNMHVLVEGVVQYELKAVLKFLIFEPSVFTIKQFNDNFDAYFSQFRRESCDTPTSISLQILHNSDHSLRQSCSKLTTLLRAMPFILNGLIDFENEYFILVKQLLEISNIIWSTNVSHGTLDLLKILIENHLVLFKRLFPDLNIMPKQHFLLHVASITKSLGPSEMYSCSHFETKHKRYKRRVYIRMNYKNVAKTVVKSVEREQCLENAVDRAADHPMFSNTTKTSKTKRLLGQEMMYIKHRLRRSCNVQEDTVIAVYSAKSITIGSYIYVVDYTFVAFDASEYQILYGLLQDIYIVNGNRIFFDVIVYDTEYFNENLQSFKIVFPEVVQNNSLIEPGNLLDFRPYQISKIENDLYIQVHSDVTDVLAIHSAYRKPQLFNKLNEKLKNSI